MNKGFLIGNVVKTPELRTTNSGKSVTTLRLGVSRGEKDSMFYDITFFDKQAETLCQYIDKGREIHVEYRLNTYEHAKGDVKVMSLELIGNDFKFLGKRKDE